MMNDSPKGARSKDLTSSTLRSRFAGYAWLARASVPAFLLLATFVLCLFLLGVAQRRGWVNTVDGKQTRLADDGVERRFICPMMCVPPTSQPGRCPVCGMELVEATNRPATDGISFTIDPAARRLVGIQTAEAQLKEVSRTIRTIGSIDFDQSQLTTISAYIDGRLEKMYADYVGVPVNERDDLALLYSPQMYTAQVEFLSALQRDTSNRFIDPEEMLQLATEKLVELGMSTEQIESLRESKRAEPRIRINSSQSGTVIEKMAVEGDYVKTGQALYRVADLSTVWLMLDLFPEDAALIRFGQEVEAEIASAPGVQFSGRVAFVNPTVDKKTRSVRVRVEMPNRDGKLRPGDYATAQVYVPAIAQDWTYDPALANKWISPMHPRIVRDQAGTCPVCDMDLIPTSDLGFSPDPIPEQRVIAVPRDAVLLAGQNSVVYVETEPGRFEVRRVALGGLTSDSAIVAEGIQPGERVATDGNFLLDSQSQLAGNPSLLDPSKASLYPPGPLVVPKQLSRETLDEESSNHFDALWESYFAIQAALAGDQLPQQAELASLETHSGWLAASNLPESVTTEFYLARNAVDRFGTDLESTRIAFRTVSHALLRAISMVEDPASTRPLVHYYCPMVPGGGGDWLQAGDPLRNPYWGAAMLTCGERVNDVSVNPELTPEPITSSMDDDPFEGVEVQSLDLDEFESSADSNHSQTSDQGN